MSEQTEHERIWLEPKETGESRDEGRCWCQDNAWGDEATEYVRADLVRPQAGAAEAAAWRSIKTAPKDGTHIIGSNDDDTAFVCAWFPDDDCDGGDWLEWGTDLVNPTRWIPMPSAAPLVQPTPGEAVTIKPLEWIKSVNSDNFWRASSALGLYRIWTHAEAHGRWFWQLFNHDIPETKDAASLDEAKAAAQADYEARIRSALVTRPDAQPDSTGGDNA